MSDTVTIPRDVLQKVLDFAVSADSACSGYADDEEVEALRAAAVALGVDPIAVTPYGFQCKYLGEHQWWRGVGETSDWRRPPYCHQVGKPDFMQRYCCRCKHTETRPMTADDLVAP
jgi:hypothetical protein